MRLTLIAIQRLQIKIELAQVLGLEATNLQFDRYQAVEATVEDSKSSAKSRPPT